MYEFIPMFVYLLSRESIWSDWCTSIVSYLWLCPRRNELFSFSVGRKIQIIYPTLYYWDAFRRFLTNVILFSLYISLLFLSFIKIVGHLWGIKNLRLFLQRKFSVQSRLQWNRKGVEISKMLALLWRSAGFFLQELQYNQARLCVFKQQFACISFFYPPFWIHPFVQQVSSCSVGQQTVNPSASLNN